MLPTKRRIKKESFTKILKEGVFVSGDTFYLRLLDRRDGQPSLFGFVIPNKIEKTSVGRHRLKRQMTAAVENLLIQIKPGFSCLFLAKKKVTPTTSGGLDTEIFGLVKKAGLLK